MPIHMAVGTKADTAVGMGRTARVSAALVDRDIGAVARSPARNTFPARSASHQGVAPVLVGNPWAYVLASSHFAKVCRLTHRILAGTARSAYWICGELSPRLSLNTFRRPDNPVLEGSLVILVGVVVLIIGVVR
jgi:hypothetical protein